MTTHDRHSDGVEHWRRHPGQYGGYEVSTRGNVRNATTGRLLSLYQYRDHRGYWKLLVSLPGRPKPKRRRGEPAPRSPGSKRVRVARLVLETFVGPPPDPKAMALHHDGDSLRCRLENLCWGGHLENVADRERHRAEREAAEAAELHDDIPF